MNQSLEPTIQRLKLQQREQTDQIVSQALIAGRDFRIYYRDGEPLPFRAMQAGWIGHGDTIFESMAQLANKLALATYWPGFQNANSFVKSLTDSGFDSVLERTKNRLSLACDATPADVSDAKKASDRFARENELFLVFLVKPGSYGGRKCVQITVADSEIGKM